MFIDKVRDIVGLYLDPPQGAMVLAVDEKSQIQALDRTAPMLPMMPGVPGRTTHDYVCDRQGVFDKAIEMLRLGKKLGYHMITNTTVWPVVA